MFRSPYVKLTILAALGLILFLASRPKPQPSPSTPPPPPSKLIAPPKPEDVSERIIRLPVADQADLLNNPAESAQEDLAIIDLLITEFRRHFAGNPVGENEEITASLTGRNPKGLVYLSPDSPAIDANGRLTDRWGSPYFFHALAADRMQITSPGPDRQLHTADDLTLDR